jgi:hypothetical protein
VKAIDLPAYIALPSGRPALPWRAIGSPATVPPRSLPSQVARLLVNMHNQVAAGDFSYVQEMRAAAAAAAAQAAAAAAASQRAPNGHAEADDDSSSEEGSSSGDDDDDAIDAEVGAPSLQPALYPLAQAHRPRLPFPLQLAARRRARCTRVHLCCM